MSDVRFACPFCTQHIACDRSFSGAPIDCPSCGRRIVVPQPIAAYEMRPGIPVARPAAKSSDLGLWTEDAWREHVRRNPGIYSLGEKGDSVMPQLPAALAIVLPFLVALGANATTMWIAIIVGALISSLWMRHCVGSEASMMKSAAAYLIGAASFAICAEIVLFGGCCWPGHML